MMDLKLWLSILMVCEMAESMGPGQNWLISVPPVISVLESSCVVIPCMYDYPKKGHLWKKRPGYWRRGDDIVASNNPKFKVTQEFKGRSKITGIIERSICTWQLNDVRVTDAGPFYLTIEIPGFTSYTFSKDTVALNVFQVPEPPVMTIEVSNKVTATCKVTHVCPTSPPKISWSHPGTTTTTTKLTKTWLTTSTLTFTPEEADFNKPLNCTVNFSDKKTAEGSVLLVKKST
ncbi:sialic acid-binding Ig-like lectin 12 [Poecilia formosa]|uniref:sialic acid-binding Ig-like lectin 12 n=1 Tax=Poecilia formosa TaxID=48698 RepID=UPI0007B8E0D5|nr:PREDICTED: sialic acid-binding Ig-like lectin 12 [Poecilia formosa]